MTPFSLALFLLSRATEIKHDLLLTNDAFDMSLLSQGNKRARPVVSCLRCREKKLKCDRADPCENCNKAGQSDCTYNQHPESIPRAKRIQLAPEIAKRPEEREIGIIEDVQQRLARVEELLAIRDSRDLPTQNSWLNDLPSPRLQSHPGTLVVKGSRSRYHGQNGRITLLNQFDEAKGFVNQCCQDSSIVKLAKEVQFLQSKTKSLFSSPQSISELEGFPELLQLLKCLPPKEVCDRLLTIYTTNFEQTLRILHVPSFLRQYDEFWAHSDDELYLGSSFVPQLTSVLAVSVTLGDKVIEADHYDSWEYLKLNSVNLLQAWLRNLPRKHRTELATLQIETLILLARQLRSVAAEESWKEAGSLVRSAMVMGLHVNFSGSTKMSIYQAEIRRRLWFTIAEMDLQASITTGMPIMTPQLDFHDVYPANLNDSDFDHTTTELPDSKPSEERTDSLALITLAKSLSHRIMAVNTAHHLGLKIDSNEYMKQRQTLENYLRDIHSSLRMNRNSSSQSDPSVLFNQFLLDLYIRRPLLCLYRSVKSKTPDLSASSLDSSLAVLSYQDYFDPNLADLDVQNSSGYWDIFHTFCQNDIMSAALGVCEYMKLSTQNADQVAEGPDPTTSAPHTKASLIRMVENTLDSLSRRIGEAGNNFKDILLLSVVLQSVRGRGSLETKQGWMMQGAKKALSACRQYLLTADAVSSFGLQQTDPTHPSTVQSDSVPSAFLQMPDLNLAADFANFPGLQNDLFSFDEDAFAWNS
ncbi:uncharacterized protein N7506_000760 [Penicillium brevicompactum]|uniref:uncharacterized protein n=1 Tax=Penicillium brevicompactum TaxID=5074 RepID=UPI0025423DC8|nr:uncharacterized protein N7506_000760 [Penicillium brevicompactum]KAJ5347507.1 hypothetical protein N7506_000760 [Penicillium brevicompactum]